jgi:predicted amidohydrolase
MRIALFQFAPVWENKDENKKKIRTLLDDLQGNSDLFIFPEMSLTGFTMNSAHASESIDGNSSMFFSTLARELSAHIMAGIVEENEGRFYNTLLHFNRHGNLAARYRKIHPFSYAQENLYYQGGSESVVTEAEGVKIGLSVCYDLRFPELFRQYAKQRADLIVNIANWPDKRIDHWRALAKARAIENIAWFAGVNRVGSDPYASYNGCSTLISPTGSVVTELITKEKIVMAELDKEISDQTRSRFRFLDDIKMI